MSFDVMYFLIEPYCNVDVTQYWLASGDNYMHYFWASGLSLYSDILPIQVQIHQTLTNKAGTFNMATLDQN